MSDQVHRQMQRLETQKAELLSTLQSWPEERLSFSPEPGSWNAIQILDHLEKSERAITQAAMQNGNRTEQPGLDDRLRGRFIDRVFLSDRRVKVPASASRVLPGEDVSLGEVLARWAESRGFLVQTVARLTPEQLKPGVFRHPVAGWKNWPQVLRFFSVHITHHEHQVQRLWRGFESSIAS